jgi:Dimerisation domain
MSEAHSQRQVLNQIFGGSWITQGIYVAAELGIADLLAQGPRSAEELAEQTNTHSEALHRVLRALASVGIFAQDSQRPGVSCCIRCERANRVFIKGSASLFFTT